MTSGTTQQTTAQLASLTLLRILIGWHFLYEGLAKLMNPNWSAVAFLRDSAWILSGLLHWIAETPLVLRMVDALNAWGLTLIGLGLMLGLMTRAASLAGIVLLLFYYLAAPPFTGYSYRFAVEGQSLLVSKNLIEATALAVLYFSPASRRIGWDRLRQARRTP